MIKVQDLTKNYGDVQAVKSINFEINDGEIVGFLGENGAGKTTTLKMLTGYLVPTAGNVEINDLNISDSAFEIQKQIGYLPELNPLYPEMSVYEYLEIFINGLRLRYNVDFVPFTTASVKYNIAIPSGSEVTYKSIKQPT